jgi:hypothetical protein
MNMTPFPTIPSTATPFFIEDSAPVDVNPGNPWQFNPGVVETSLECNSGQTVTVWLTGGQIALLPSPNPPTMFNLDVQLGLYGVGPGGLPPGTILQSASPYGSGNPQMLSTSAVAGISPVSRAVFTPEQPLVLQAVAPASGGPFQIGPVFFFSSGLSAIYHCHYFYQLIGAWQAQ